MDSLSSILSPVFCGSELLATVQHSYADTDFMCGFVSICVCLLRLQVQCICVLSCNAFANDEDKGNMQWR